MRLPTISKDLEIYVRESIHRGLPKNRWNQMGFQASLPASLKRELCKMRRLSNYRFRQRTTDN
jgi:hypothetical protein